MRRLSAQELDGDIRLACRHQLRQGDQFALLPMAAGRSAEHHVLRNEAHGDASLAIDLGTTTIEWRVVDDRGLLAHGLRLNPQLSAGSEVLSRLAYAAASPQAAQELRNLVVDAVADICASMGADLAFHVKHMCLAGNTVMTHIALGLPITGLTAAPYRLAWQGGEWTELGSGLSRCYVPPLWGPFVGGDISAGLAALWCGMPVAPQEPFLLADLGTNGEFVLAAHGRYWAASVPMGPALEGIGPACGAMAQPGAVVGFTLGPSGLEPRWYGGTAPAPPSRPAGLTGTAYLALLAILRRAGLLAADGRFSQPSSPLGAKLATRLETYPRGEIRFVLGQPGGRDEPAAGLYLCAADVEEVLKVKAAFDAAVSRLLAEAGLTASALRRVCLAGTLGLHANPQDLECLGFLPPGLAARTVAVGNTSLEGATALLSLPDLRQRLEAQRVTVLDLASDAAFGPTYVQRMVFSHVG